jgi:hypothetical protein
VAQKRSLHEAIKKYESKVDGYVLEPLTTIPFENAVVDPLHMMLRITDKLMHHVVEKIRLLG